MVDVAPSLPEKKVRRICDRITEEAKDAAERHNKDAAGLLHEYLNGEIDKETAEAESPLSNRHDETHAEAWALYTVSEVYSSENLAPYTHSEKQEAEDLAVELCHRYAKVYAANVPTNVDTSVDFNHTDIRSAIWSQF